MSRPSALLWDHDGVLVDTEPVYYEATRATLAGVGIDLPRPSYLRLMADGVGYFGEARERGMSDAAIAALRESRNALYQRLLRTAPIDIPGVEDVLMYLARSHRMAIVTTSRGDDFELIHRTRTLTRHFELILTREDYVRSKPAPDPYLRALELLGVSRADAVVIEDSERGLRSAVAAGVRCIVIRSEFTQTHDFSGAWRHVDSLDQIAPLLTDTTARE